MTPSNPVTTYTQVTGNTKICRGNYTFSSPSFQWMYRITNSEDLVFDCNGSRFNTSLYNKIAFYISNSENITIKTACWTTSRKPYMQRTQAT